MEYRQLLVPYRGLDRDVKPGPQSVKSNLMYSMLQQVWHVMAHAQKPDLSLSAKRTSPFKPAVGRQFSRLLAAEVCGISGSNAGYTMFRGSVKWYWLPTAFASFPFTSPPVRHRVHVTFQLESIFEKGRNCSTGCNLYTFQRRLLLSSIDRTPNYHYHWSTYLRNTQIKWHLSTAYVIKNNTNCQYGNRKQRHCDLLRSLYALRIHAR